MTHFLRSSLCQQNEFFSLIISMQVGEKTTEFWVLEPLSGWIGWTRIRDDRVSKADQIRK